MDATADTVAAPTVATPETTVATERPTAETHPPWTIRNMPPADRDAAAAAAKRAQMTMAEWLGLAIRAYVAAERSNGAPYGEVMPPGGAGQAVVPVGRTVGQPPPDRINDLARLVQLARDLSPAPDDSLVKLARGVVRDRLKAMRAG